MGGARLLLKQEAGRVVLGRHTLNLFPPLFPRGWLLVALAAGFALGRRRSGRLQVKLDHTEASLRRISQAVESTSDAVGIGDMQGHSLYHNRAHLELFGDTVDELNGVPGDGVLFADKTVAHEILAAVKGDARGAARRMCARATGGRCRRLCARTLSGTGPATRSGSTAYLPTSRSGGGARRSVSA